MILSAKNIQRIIEKGELQVKPEPKFKEASIKIHLSGEIGSTVNNKKKENIYKLKPKEFVLATSLEQIKLSEKYAGLYDGYVGLAKQGIITHMGSMLIDPGFEGKLILEIFNASDKEIILRGGDRVGQLAIIKVSR
ncbi:hypothetical protein A2Z22_04990 [Candidatus Woesebacteria bacterium RBG_16_34_12]|uniref:Uncharacterized protein n=1 Tax=Candidatus Woesebacteria bacterium RBG_16_34_12 TaxID=1802480 RepID=A0A1F7XAD0_9BACT|nr:MAG: hypothetical protein A2Z22_04990 [Candidatus Woesebacteria bacterium RBG_16_34_12]